MQYKVEVNQKRQRGHGCLLDRKFCVEVSIDGQVIQFCQSIESGIRWIERSYPLAIRSIVRVSDNQALVNVSG